MEHHEQHGVVDSELPLSFQSNFFFMQMPLQPICEFRLHTGQQQLSFVSRILCCDVLLASRAGIGRVALCASVCHFHFISFLCFLSFDYSKILAVGHQI